MIIFVTFVITISPLMIIMIDLSSHYLFVAAAVDDDDEPSSISHFL
jgi:hypothetical protein